MCVFNQLLVNYYGLFDHIIKGHFIGNAIAQAPVKRI